MHMPRQDESVRPADVVPGTELSHKAPARSAARRLARLGWVVFLSTVALVHPVASLLARVDWRADLLTHFREPALAVTVVAALLLVRTHRWVAAGLICLSVAQATALLAYSGSNPVRPDPRLPDRLKILMANVFVDNDRYADLDALIRSERPDIVGLVELTPRWDEALEGLSELYPYRLDLPTGTSGLALWFRERPERIGPPRVPLPGGSPAIHAEFRFAGQTRHLWLLHPTMPLARKGLPELPALARWIGATEGSKIVIGDLNSSEGSPLFHDFVRRAGVRDSRLGFGRQPSWPSDMPYRIAIDHVFVTDDIAVTRRRLGPMIGSDHFPLIVELAPADAAMTKSPSQSKRSAPSGAGSGG